MHNGWENADPVRKSFGAFLVAWALVVVAIYAPLPWWGAVLVGLAVWLGLVAGLKINGATALVYSRACQGKGHAEGLLA